MGLKGKKPKIRMISSIWAWALRTLRIHHLDCKFKFKVLLNTPTLRTKQKTHL